MPSAKTLSVVMVSAGFHPYIGGAEKQALELAQALRQRGIKVSVVTRRLKGLAAREEVQGVPVVRLWCAGSGLINSATFMVPLFLYLLDQAAFYDVIHAHLASSPALAAALAGWLRRKPVWIKLGGGRGIGELAVSSKSFSGRFKLKLLSWLKPRFVAVSHDLAQEAAAYLGKVSVFSLSNGVNARRYRPVSLTEKSALRAKFGWPQGLGFLYVGRLSPEKRLPYFLEVWAQTIKEAKSKAFIAFVGQGWEKQRIEEVVSHQRIKDGVFFHPATQDVGEFYAAADIFILPSISEGLSNALLEAMASGLAVLASRVGGTAEAVDEAKNGFLFAPEDAQEISNQLRKFLEHPELAAQMGRVSRGLALERYSLDKIAERYETLYKESLPR